MQTQEAEGSQDRTLEEAPRREPAASLPEQRNQTTWLHRAGSLRLCQQEHNQVWGLGAADSTTRAEVWKSIFGPVWETGGTPDSHILSDQQLLCYFIQSSQPGPLPGTWTQGPAKLPLPPFLHLLIHSSVGNTDIDVAYTKTLILLEAELFLWELISKWPTSHPSITQVLHSLPCTSIKSVILSEAEFEGAYQGYSPHPCDHQSDTSARRGINYYQLTRWF